MSTTISDTGKAYLRHRNYDNKIGDEMRKFNEIVEHGHIDLKQAALVRPLMETMRSLVYDALEIMTDFETAAAYAKHRNFDNKIGDEMRKFNEMVEHAHLELPQAAILRPLMESLRSLVYDAIEVDND